MIVDVDGAADVAAPTPSTAVIAVKLQKSKPTAAQLNEAWDDEMLKNAAVVQPAGPANCSRQAPPHPPARPLARPLARPPARPPVPSLGRMPKRR